MLEEILKILLQYGALGAMVFFLMWKDSKKIDKTNEILEKIAEIYKESITHERGVSKECYDKVINKLDGHHNETMDALKDLTHKMDMTNSR